MSYEIEDSAKLIMSYPANWNKLLFYVINLWIQFLLLHRNIYYYLKILCMII